MREFFKPDDPGSDDDVDISLIDEFQVNFFGIAMQMPVESDDESVADSDLDFSPDEILDDTDDELVSGNPDEVAPTIWQNTRSRLEAGTSSHRVSTASGIVTSTSDEDDDSDAEENDEEEDDVVRAIVAATKTPRCHPPDIITEDFVVDLSFHPEEDILAVGTLTGDVIVYKYNTEENTLMTTLEVHTKAIRDIEFNLDGSSLFSASKDKSIMLSDVHTGKLKRFYDNAHDAPIYRLSVFCENLFASGDEDGTLKLWDIRDKDPKPIFSLKEVDDYISGIITNSAKKLLLTTSGDGYLTSYSIGTRKMYVQSEPYEEELTCMGLFRNESKLVVGSSKGRIYTYNWGEFGLHSNMFPGTKSPMNLMVPITERIAVVGGEEGILRAMHVVPGRNLGIVGQHSLGVEAIDICASGDIIASSSHDNDIKFWNIKYFEDFDDIKYNEKHNKQKEMRHNLPSSKQSNAGDFFADLQ